MIDEVFEIISAVNRLKDKVGELCTKFDSHLKVPDQEPESKYVEESGACKILKISPRTLAKLRAENKILYIKNGHKILYLASDLDKYLTQNIKR